MLFGAAVSAAHLRDPAFRYAVSQETGALTAEFEMKWSHVEPRQGTFQFREADEIANFSQAHKKRLHGHTLLWHRSIPGWAMEGERLQANWGLVERFVASMTRRYAGVASWDVVNEPMEPMSKDGLRETPFLDAFGPDYIKRALVTAREHAPQAILCINEYGIEYDTPEQQMKRDTLLNLLTKLRHDGVPLDCLGIQAHLDLSIHHRFSPLTFAKFLDKVGSLGLQIRISELDVRETDTNQTIEKRDRDVAQAVSTFLDVALRNRAVGSVTCWGLSDRYSWLDAPAGNRGLPLDGELNPKQMREAIREAISNRPA